MVENLLDLAALALEEDRAENDLTTLGCGFSDEEIAGKIVLKQRARIAGLVFLPYFFPNVQIHVEEGEEGASGMILATIQGPAGLLLSRERSALNVIQHISGIATMTARYVKEVEGYACEIRDTRKTLPGLRRLQKYGVRMGGGKNHRMDLADAILIKNNHIRLVGSIEEAIKRVGEKYPSVQIEVEVETLSQLESALACGVKMILLDNMSPALVLEAVELSQGRAYLEASGNINLENVRAYAATGVDGVSIGALTHSVRAVDMSLKL
jgi:nicotinate-nucleotide pyrophosphorylase (carboxylating)